MENYYKKLKRELMRDILMLILYVLCSVGIVYGIIQMMN